ncbi:tail fiber protein [Salmonella enterica subsp. enterica serovar Virginia]|nr:phage tail protein [Salmonella enterica]ECZ0676174.1 phage tail protein [Salmonella enterica subsp. enterica serovar Agona]EDO5763515.1 phage tail protein [Salmonella enterica subsp. enterica serovar Newport]EHT7585043.1 tail fiber protein [Salmonella enterica subsp. enterica serovar Montevideo]EHT8599599.1 tail fiber protein [Salmonella enterica subsp. enterica serovar Muenchen]MEA5677433.1 tail fiber protein [Salmonella enterica subsp. enterica serovar Virginia]
MFYIDNDSGVTVMPPVSAQRSAIVRWFSEGDGNNVITWPGMDWFNIVQAELLNTLEEAGIQPDKTKLNQLALSIKAIMNKNALLIKNNLSEIKTAGASAQRTARENLDIYDASLNKKGLVQLTSATDSPSETLAATAKAVKIAMDNANARLAKDRNGADIPNKPLFIQNVGLGETAKQAAGAVQKTGDEMSGKLTLPQTSSFGVNTNNTLGGSSIAIGDNDTGFKQNGDGILDTFANSQHTVRVAPGEMMVLGAIRAGKEKKLSLTSNNNSTMTATFNLWGDANRPTVIELDDDQGWHLYSQRNPDGSIVFTVNGDITANTLRAGGAIYQNNGDIFGSVWGNSWLSLWINNNFVADVQLGAGTSVTTWNNAGSWPNTPGYVVTSVWKDAQGENIDGINYAPLQKRVGNQWYTVQGGTA